ncbi:DUF4349 domain-containing protein [Thalassolituus sp. LLYu03]|uniref:DUF4349 domain-containing protein n=1 Tax=Thalassolituus sp. LLYu03 TaxID=3421656 RepID=UPI003D26DCDF
MTNTRFLLLPLFVGAMSMFAGCASVNGAVYEPQYAAGANEPQSSERMVIKSASLEIEVEDILSATDSLNQLVKTQSGYVESSNGSDDKARFLSIRIPQQQFESLLQGMGSLGKIKTQRISSRDVTDSLVDYQAKLNNQIVLRDRMRALLDKANKIDDILVLEKELARLQTEIDRLTALQKNLQQQVAMSAVDVTLEKKVQLGPLGYVGYGIYWAISKLFVIE